MKNNSMRSVLEPAISSISIGSDALVGFVAEIAKIVGPHTESDLSALVIQTLAAFGNVVGKTAHFEVDGVRHYMNLFVALVGDSAKSRKGTSWARIRSIFDRFDGGYWARTRNASGLSTSEGLVFAVRDPRHIRTPSGRLVYDPGIQDKRLLIQEPEFSSC